MGNYKQIIAASLAALCMAGTAQASSFLMGDFDVTVVNATNRNNAESRATLANFDAALGNCGGTVAGSTYSCDLDFSYDGALDFRTSNGSGNKIATWLDSGNGLVSDLDPVIGDLQQSKGSIGDGTATTTFYRFTLASLGVAEFKVTHDDGIAFFDDGVLIGSSVGPNSEKTTTITGFDGGKLDILYVATNSDPSILEVMATVGPVPGPGPAPVPLPAGLPLLVAGLGSLWAVRRRARG